MALTAILATLGQAANSLSGLGLFGGGSSGASVPFTQGDIETMFRKISADQLQWLKDRWAADSSKKSVPVMPTDAATFYFYAAGGADHKVTSSAGKAFVQQVAGLIATMGGTLTGASSAPGGGAASPGVVQTIGQTMNAAAGDHPNAQANPLLTSSVFGVPVWALLALAAVLVFFYLQQD